MTTTLTFFEKPGCANGTKQKKLLAEAGYALDTRNLLSEPWTAESLRPYLAHRPVAAWFNKASPRVKSGAVDPAAVTEDEALALMVADPLLIRRPLMNKDGERRTGFDDETRAWLGLPVEGDLESCPRSHAKTPCPTE